MPDNILSRDFNLLHLRLQKRLNRLCQNGNAADIHDYRSVYMQMEAFCMWCMGFMKEPDGTKLERWLSKQKTLYKKTGKIRTVQLMLKAGGKLDIWHEIPHIEAELKHSRKVLIKEFASLLKKSRKSSSHKILKIFTQYDTYPESLLVENILQFIEGNRRKAMEKLKFEPDIPWHEARLLIRTNYYLIKLTKLPDKDFSDDMFLGDKKLIKDLGVWHEWLVFHQYLVDKGVSTLHIITLLKNNIRSLEKTIIITIHLEEKNYRQETGRDLLL
jgi:hypothetical protein